MGKKKKQVRNQKKKQVKKSKGAKNVKRSPKQVKTEKKYNASYAKRVKILVIELGAVNLRGEVAWTKIAKALGIGVETIRNWRKESGPYYHKEFADACEEAIEAADLGKIKRDTITAAGRHVKHRRTRELRSIGPKPPKSTYTKALLVRYAAEVLKPPLKLNIKSRKVELMYEIERAIEEQTKGEMQVVKIESQEIFGEPAARTIALTNLGPPEKQWMGKEGRVHDVSDPLTRLFKEIGEQPTRLPGEEMGIMANDDKRDGKEPEGPVLADEQSILDSG